MSKPKKRLLYKETYTSPGAKIADDKIPEVSYLNPGYKVKEAHIREVGAYEENGKRYEYQDVRFVIEECHDANCTLCKPPVERDSHAENPYLGPRLRNHGAGRNRRRRSNRNRQA